MIRETKVASIPDVRDDNVGEVLRAIKNVLQVREGQLGDPLDQNVTIRDLTDLKIVALGGSTTLTGGATVPVINPTGNPDGYNPTTDLTTPPAPTGLTASSGFSNVYLSWSGAPYRNHAYTEIWRGTTNVLGDAVRVGTTNANVYADAAEEGKTYYYWIRFVSQADVVGPYNATAGTPATTATSPTALLNVLSNQITSSQLANSLASRINLIDAPASTTNSVAWQVAQEAAARTTAIQNESSARAAAILSEASARSTADSALQTQINTIVAAGSSDTATILAALQDEQTARISADSAEATARQTLATQMRGSYTGTDITQVTTGLLYSESTARSTADSALSSSITALSSTVTNNYNTLNSAITTEATTRASGDAANATSITNLTATVNTKARTFYQSTTPTATAVGDLWMDTGNGNTIKRWDGSAWVAVDDARISANAAAITAEQTARATADTALSQSISTLSTTVTNNYNTLNSAITSEQTARSTADTALANSIYQLQSTASGLDTGISWNYDSTSESFSVVGATLSWSNGSIQVNSSGIDPQLYTPALTLDGSKNYLIRMRVMRLAGSGWDGKIYYTTGSHGLSESYKKTIADGTALNEWRILEWDMSSLTAGGTDWIGSTITQFRVDLGSSSGDQFLIDWISVGRVAPQSYSAQITQEASTRASADSALSTQITTLSSTVTGNYNTLNAAIQSEATTRATQDSALSSSITTLQASVNNNTVAIQNEQTARANADGSLFAQYTVKIDNNGYVSGFGLASTNVNGTPTSLFAVRADRFAIINPNNNRSTVTSFSVGFSTGSFNTSGSHGFSVGDTIQFTGASAASSGVTGTAPITAVTSNTFTASLTYAQYIGLSGINQSGMDLTVSICSTPFIVSGGSVYMNTAFIQNATITDAKIATVTADKITTGTLTAAISVNTGVLYGGVNPTGYATGTSYFGTGFLLGSYQGAYQFFVGSPDKNVNWNGTDLTVKGTIEAYGGSIGGNIIDANGIRSSNYVAGTTGFQINKNGDVDLNSGNFRGTLSVKSGTSGERMEITNSVIKIFDASGVVRVKLGDLNA
jgi:hypothetical protein